MTSSWMRCRTSGSSIRSPSGPRYTKPRPCLRRRRPGPVQSARRRRGGLDRAAVVGTRPRRTRPSRGTSAPAASGRRRTPAPRAGASALGRGLLRRRLALGGGLALGLGAVAVLVVRGRAPAVALAPRVEAGLEGGHEVGHGLLRLLARGLHRDLLARGLALDEREDLLAVGVVVLVGLEVAGQ